MRFVSKILGIEILNEGSGISVDDAVTQSQATFVARAIEPLQAIVSPLDQGSPSRLTTPASRARASPAATAGSRTAEPRASPPAVLWLLTGIGLRS